MSKLDSCPIASEAAPAAEVQVQRLRHGELQRCADVVAEEFPVALVYNGISHAVMMATPQDLEEFATGFSLSEGIISRAQEIHDLEVNLYPDGAEIQLTIAQPAFLKLKDRRRSLTGRTGCGVCGTESLALLDLIPEKLSTPPEHLIDHACIQRILAELTPHQSLMQATGCAHAAAWCSLDGHVMRVFEDVGRHNALDKLFGWVVLNDVDVRQGLVFLTSRASYELVRKSARMGVSQLATISAPTALAIRIAQTAGIRLMSFCRQNGFVEYPATSA